MRAGVLGLLLLLVAAAAAQECVVIPLATDVIEVSGCVSVTVEPFNGTAQSGGPGQYQLPATLGCNAVLVTGNETVLYRICGQTASPVACPVGPFVDPLSAARACAHDLSIQCAEECCDPPAPPAACCTAEEVLEVTTWVGHGWADLVGTDGIAVVAGDSRVRAEGGFLIGSCSVTGGDHIGCLLGEDLVATREIFVPACNTTLVTVRLVVESVVSGAVASLGGGAAVPVGVGTVQLTGSAGPLVLTVPVPTCSSGLAFNISVLEIDTHCTTTINRTVECPPPGTFLLLSPLPLFPREDPICAGTINARPSPTLAANVRRRPLADQRPPQASFPNVQITHTTVPTNPRCTITPTLAKTIHGALIWRTSGSNVHTNFTHRAQNEKTHWA